MGQDHSDRGETRTFWWSRSKRGDSVARNRARTRRSTRTHNFPDLDDPSQRRIRVDRCSFKMTGGNSGIQYQGRVVNEDEFVRRGFTKPTLTRPTITLWHLYEERAEHPRAFAARGVVIAKTVRKTEETFARFQPILAKGIFTRGSERYRIVVRGNPTRNTTSTRFKP